MVSGKSGLVRAFALIVLLVAFTGYNLPGRDLVGSDGTRFPPPPAVPSGDITLEARAAIDTFVAGVRGMAFDRQTIESIGAGGDPRLLWFVSDARRFAGRADRQTILDAFAALTGVSLPVDNFNAITNHLIAWEIPAYPGYSDDKRALFLRIDPRWAPFFDDRDTQVDWRFVEWGGVLIDDRIDARPGLPCYRCIPALDDPAVTDAAGGNWYPEDKLVFGVVINGEARAYPKHIMEIHEMVNDTLGGRRFAMPYCTLCGSAQAFFTDDVGAYGPVLRTSGLLVRSNKLSYDLTTMSAIDTFSGRALSGPLRAAGVKLNQVSVVTSTWGDWKREYPDTTILSVNGGAPGAPYPYDPLRGRDDKGPIFPVGDVDPRLPVQERVLGVIANDGTPLAFPVSEVLLALEAGERVIARGVAVAVAGSGLRATNTVGGSTSPAALASHEAFWFAWSQFHPDTVLWRR